MDLKEFFEKERMNYLKGFKTVHAITKEKGDSEFEISVEYLDKEEMPPNTIENPLSFFRYDIIVTSRENGNNYEVKVKTEPTIFAEALVFQEKGLEIRIESFSWNACEFRFSEPEFKGVGLKDWYKKWIKPEQKEVTSEFKQVIHNGTRLTEVENKKGILIDFGTIAYPSCISIAMFSDFKDNLGW